MNTQDFCYWLQDYFELAMTPTKEGLTPQQVEVIKEHLRLVFKKEAVKEAAADAVKNFYDDYAEREFRSNQRTLLNKPSLTTTNKSRINTPRFAEHRRLREVKTT